MKLVYVVVLAPLNADAEFEIVSMYVIVTPSDRDWETTVIHTLI